MKGARGGTQEKLKENKLFVYNGEISPIMEERNTIYNNNEKQSEKDHLENQGSPTTRVVISKSVDPHIALTQLS